jgi:Ser/Thr protein kinase RdoA (MazF antagonist)
MAGAGSGGVCTRVVAGYHADVMSAAPPRPRRPPPEVLAAYGLAGVALEPVVSGLVNATWIASAADGERRVLQWVHPVFNPETQYDIDAVTRHLERKSLVTPRFIPTDDGQLFHADATGTWRLLTYIDGETRETVRAPKDAREAGRLLATFHAAVDDLDHTLRGTRGNVHHLERHLDALRAALAEHTEHRHRAAVGRLADEIFALAAAMPEPAPVPERLTHGDPKISNIVFDARGRAVCLIDLDTIARMPVVAELGDAFRSWCNAHAEDAPDGKFDPALFAAACRGYQAGAPDFLGPAEWRQLPASTARIALELAARFAADALNERYFRWDPGRYADASEHNQARAASQARIARQVLDAAGELSRLVAAIFA